ncbi:hypothetical protein [Paenibacillus tianjinensis]|uniref:Uncharacterized protein n=1 Tax=Paenibacillus tianjinensis TaxID=2810347 RepID=A0ABX7L5U5_9BACL|nr:hypothetical protein [Paenibacillus tianjinensis]QSF43478.1 hypothetical protein JRJ22_19635 [Paenibacillus tianjinensis]
MRKIIRNFINGDSKALKDLDIKDSIKYVYTIIDENKYTFNPKTGKQVDIDSDDAYLGHLDNVFLEDYYHDWRVDEGVFKFYGHSGKKGQKHDLLIVYK